jgi:biopolymer transport protein ExbD
VHVPELDVSTGGRPPESDREPWSAEEPLPVALEDSVSEPSGEQPNRAAPLSVTTDAGWDLDDSEGEDEDEDDQPLFETGPREPEELDMTPMVDVTFLLLIFFMVTAAFSLQKSIQMPRQQTDAPSTAVIDKEEDELDMVEVQVDEFGGFFVMAPEFERETPGKQNLIATLKEAIAGSPDGMRLIIKVHELAKLRYLVDAMDAGTIAGYPELKVTQVEEFD